MMHAEKVVQEHIVICDEVHQILLEEHSLLKHTESLPDDDFYKRKQALLPKLDCSLKEIKELPRESIRPAGVQNLIQSAQKKLMKIMMLDRENEQLLLKYSKPAKSSATPVTRRVSKAQISAAYSQRRKP